MKTIEYANDRYQTPAGSASLLKRLLPTLFFYPPFAGIIMRSSRLAKKGAYGYEEWSDSSIDVLRALESVGLSIEITGIGNLANLDSPCVIIGNHMSMLETVVLPGVVQPVKKVTFIVKDTLLSYPVFRHVMRSRDPIAVTRVNPRHDFKAVMDGGVERLKKGISIIVFPQTTRTNDFDPAQFNSIGVKLAQKAGVPVVPLALLTDAWENGMLIKDFGRINTRKKAYIAFGQPLWIQNRGAEEHAQIVKFIESKLSVWKSA